MNDRFDERDIGPKRSGRTLVNLRDRAVILLIQFYGQEVLWRDALSQMLRSGFP